MSQQTIKQQARRTARERAQGRRRERVEPEARTIGPAEQVRAAVGERDAAVAAAEKRAGVTLREWAQGIGRTGPSGAALDFGVSESTFVCMLALMLKCRADN